jgi:hypothetical protein
MRKPASNTGHAVGFVINGGRRRRDLATTRAQKLQRDLGVIPRLETVKKR